MSWRLSEFGDATYALSDSTRAVYDRDVAAFVEWADTVGLAGPAAVRRADLRQYLAVLSGIGPDAGDALAPRTIRRKASALRRYFGWLAASGDLASDPTNGLS